MSLDAIGVFDSGLGGLTAVKELLSILPHENIVYFGDTGRVPYGNRSRETIINYAIQDANFLLSKNVKIILAACGTVSSVVNQLGGEFLVPFTGVVEPTARAAVKATQNGRIGVIGTTATINSNSYKREIERIDPNISVFQQDCPLFVPLVENGFIDKEDPIIRLVIERYLTGLKENSIDTLILGCTHYPILKDAIIEVMGSGVTLVDSGRETALYARDILTENKLLNPSKTKGNCQFFVSDRVEGFSRIASLFLGKEIESNVIRIQLDEEQKFVTTTL